MDMLDYIILFGAVGSNGFLYTGKHCLTYIISFNLYNFEFFDYGGYINGRNG